MNRRWRAVLYGVLQAAVLFFVLAVAGFFWLFRTSPTVFLPDGPETMGWRAGGLTFELRPTTLRARANGANGVGTRRTPVPFGDYALFDDKGRKVTVAVTGALRPQSRGPIPLINPLEPRPAPADIESLCDRVDVSEWISLLFAFDRPPSGQSGAFDTARLSRDLVLDGREFPAEAPSSSLCLDTYGGTIFNVSQDVAIGGSGLVRVSNSRTGQEVWFLVDLQGLG